jgi:UDP-N-acetylmuramoyl-tripeptide--D-alanyl-D-alanine ligase
MAEGALAGGLDRAQLVQVRNHAQICAWLQEHIASDDCVLVKGSRGMRMEKVVDFLLHKLRMVA